MKQYSYFRQPIRLLCVFTVASITLLATRVWASEIGREFNEADTALNATYKSVLGTMTDPAQKALLIKAQGGWIKFRDENVALFVARYPASKGGIFLNIEMMRARTKYLNALLECPPTSDPTGQLPSGYSFTAQPQNLPQTVEVPQRTPIPAQPTSEKFVAGFTVDKARKAFGQVNLGGGSVAIDGIRAGSGETLVDIHFTNLKFGSSPNEVYTGPAVAVFHDYTDGRSNFYEYVLLNGSGLRFRPVNITVP